MKVETTRFGVVEVDDSAVLNMPKGPLGFEDQTQFVLVQHRPDSCFKWLQSTHEPKLAFVVIDPADFFCDYEIEISDSEAEKLNLASAEDALVLAIVTITDEGKEVSANLAAPIVINAKELVGMQIVLQDNHYTIKHTLVEQVNQESNEETAEAKVTLKAA